MRQDSAGIGLATVEQLALHGAKVYLGARSEKRAQEAIQALLRKHASISKSSWIWLELDLSSPLKAERAAEEFSGKESRLDILGKLFKCDVSIWTKTKFSE